MRRIKIADAGIKILSKRKKKGIKTEVDKTYKKEEKFFNLT